MIKLCTVDLERVRDVSQAAADRRKFQKTISGLSRMSIIHGQDVCLRSQYLCFFKSIDKRIQPTFGWLNEDNASWEF